MSLSSSETEAGGIRSVLARGATAAETSTGLAVLAIGGATALVYEVAMAVGKWVPFFLSYKPLIDLTWRWQFLEILHQRVNMQALLAMFVALLNAIVVIFARRKLPHYKLVLLLLLIATGSAVLTPTSWGFNELFRLYAGVSFFFTAGLVLANKQRFDRFVDCFMGALTVPFILALCQVAGLVPYDAWDWTDNGLIGRATGTYEHPADLIFFIIYGVPLALYRLEDCKNRGASRIFPTAFLFLALLVLISTNLRMGWIAVTVQIGLWLLLKRKYKLIALAGFSLLALLLIFSERIEALYEPSTQMEVLFGPKALRGRGMDYYVFFNSYISAGPVRWLVGRGGSVAEGYVEGVGNFSSNEPHNDFLRLLHAYGLLGLLTYFTILRAFFRDSRIVRASGDYFARSIGQIVFISLVGVLFVSLTAEPMRFPTGVWYLFALASVAAILRQKLDSQTTR